jgi:hypothetical protein
VRKVTQAHPFLEQSPAGWEFDHGGMGAGLNCKNNTFKFFYNIPLFFL